MRHLVLACALLIAAGASAAIPSAERSALVDLYQSTNGPSWTENAKWLSNEPECDWYGVTCDETESNVIDLSLYYNNLDGTLPASLGNLSKVRSLQFAGNQLRGELPASFGALKQLEILYLDANQFEGQLPDALGDLAALVELGLSQNYFEGEIPASFANLRELKALNLTLNLLSGEIPAALGSLSKLELLTVGDNFLEGSLPSSLGNLSSLITFRAGYNQLTGPLPVTFSKLRALEDLDLEVNQLDGPLPDFIGDLASLKTLDLTDNAFTGSIQPIARLTNLEEALLGDNEFTGSLPRELGNLKKLHTLWLSSNALTGTIPTELGQMAALERLELQSNQLEGSIPPGLSGLANLREIDLARNKLTGPIPQELGALANLEYLSLYANELEGTIPPQLGDLVKLRIVSLNANRLTGTIPETFRKLSNVTQFTVTDNQLSGNLPSWIGEWTQLTDFFVNVNRFEGPLPAGLSALENLNYLDVSENQLTGPLIDFSRLGNLVYLVVGHNQLSGPLPRSIGSLTNLTFLVLVNNAFSGPLPPEMGNMANLEFLSIGENDFDGPLPKELAKLKKAYNLSLCCNHFSGPIPREFGELTALQYLGVSFNKLEGPIPSEITRMTGLVDHSSDFAYNALYSNDPAVRAFVNLKHGDGDFEATQTVMPANFRLVETTDRSATFSLTPIRWYYYGGGYQVVASKTPGGPAAAVATTISKSENTVTVRNLEPDTTYYFTVATVSHPVSQQENLVISERSAAVQGRTKPRVVAPAEVVVSEQPEGSVQIDGLEVVADRFTLTNFGDLPTDITLEHADDAYFTLEPKQFAIAGGASRTIAIKTTPQPPGTYYAYILIHGEGTAKDLAVSTVLLSVKRPEGTVVAQPVTTTIELAGEPGSDSVGIAQFRNTGTAELTGIVVSDQPWVVPDPLPIRIAPGTVGSVNFRIVRSKRPAGADGALTANLSLVYVDGGTAAKIDFHDGTTGVSVSKVTIIDTTKVPVTPGSIPGLNAGEMPLFIPGIANRGNARSDVSLVNAFSGNAIGDLKLYFSSGAATSIASLQPLRTSESVNFVNLAANIYGVTNGVGTLQIRSQKWASIATEAKVTAVTDAGTYSGAIPVFRADRSLAADQRIYLTGVVAGADLFVQETGGGPSRVAIEFLDASGNAAGSARSENVNGYGLLELRGAIPANAATAIITNGGPGAITAYARITNAATGDSWSVVDWSRYYGYAGDDAVRVPFADARGTGGGKRRGVRSMDIGPETLPAGRAATDLVIFNPLVTEARATLQVVGATGGVSERAITVAPRTTITLPDVGGTTSAATAHVVVIPIRGSVIVTARSHYGSFGTAIPVVAATQGLRLGQSQVFSSIEDSTAFRTSYGLVETSGVPVSVRARILIGESYSLVTATTTRTFHLGPGQQVLLPELLRSFTGTERDGYGDLHDLTVEFEVIGGNGSIVPFLVVTDMATGDPVVKMQ